jgi:small subunit ribosomal protein S2
MNMSNITLQEMLEAGVHFGHQTARWNPTMAPYIFGERNGIHIIDLQKTLPMYDRAHQFVKTEASRGGNVLFVATKKQAQDMVIEAANKCGMFHMTHRWLGGTLTNFSTVKKSIKRLQELEPMILPIQAQKKVESLLAEENDFVSEYDIADLQKLLARISGAELSDGEYKKLVELANASLEGNLDRAAMAAILENKLSRARQTTTLNKKELLKLSREFEKLNNNLGGIKNMKDLPKALFVVDINKEHIAVAEAKRLGIPVIAIVDTNTNPKDIDFPIPGNDDAIRAIQLFANGIAEAVLDGQNFKADESADVQGDDEIGVEVVNLKETTAAAEA